MKKNLLIAVALACLLTTQAAFATITFTASPSSQIASAGGTFNVTLSLNVTQNTNPADVTGYDTVFEALQSQNGGIANGAFTVTGGTAPPSQSSWQRIAAGSDALTLAGSDHSGYVQTGQNEGFGGDLSVAQSITTPFNLQMATYTFSIGAGVAPGTYNFSTTLLATSPNKFTDVNDPDQTNPAPGSFGQWPADSAATFQITVVPEPATWSLMALGGLGSFGLNLLRARRKS